MSEEKLNNISEENKQDETTYTKLLNEYASSREELKKMMKDIEDCKDTVLKSVASSNDYRNKYAREERLKTLSAFFNNMLQVRQEYNRSIQTELEMRRKLDMKDGNEMELDIRAIAKQLNNINNNK